MSSSAASASLPLSPVPIPPLSLSLAVSSLSIPFPQLFSALCLPASLPPHLSSGYMQQGTNSWGGADSEGEPEIKGKMGGQKRRDGLNRKEGKKERMTDSLGKKAGGRG